MNEGRKGGKDKVLCVSQETEMAEGSGGLFGSA